jgi:hypothetical protein
MQILNSQIKNFSIFKQKLNEIFKQCNELENLLRKNLIRIFILQLVKINY